MMADRRKSPLTPEAFEPEQCSVELRLDILARVPFFASLSGEEMAGVNRLFREQGNTPGETIYLAGDPATRLYVVASGKVKLIRHTLSGQDVLLDVLTPGEFFGSLAALGDDVYPDTAQAQTAACVLGIGADEFRAILRAYPAVAVAVLDMVAGRLTAAHEMVRQLSAHSVERRIAYTLLKLAEKLGEERDVGLLIQMPLSREDLAGMTGTTLETASRVMSLFQKGGLVRSGRGWVAIADGAGLRAVAESDLPLILKDAR
jgi:CRP-like cAMP-binding protein